MLVGPLIIRQACFGKRVTLFFLKKKKVAQVLCTSYQFQIEDIQALPLYQHIVTKDISGKSKQLPELVSLFGCQHRSCDIYFTMITSFFFFLFSFLLKTSEAPPLWNMFYYFMWNLVGAITSEAVSVSIWQDLFWTSNFLEDLTYLSNKHKKV